MTMPATSSDDRWRTSLSRLAELRSSTRALQALIAIPAALVVLALLTFVYYHLATTVQLNGDRAPLVQQAHDFLDGNWSLRGWTVGQDSYLLSELPFYILAVAIHGYRPSIVVDVSAVFYTALVASVAVTAAAASYNRSRLMSALIAFSLVAVPSVTSGVNGVLTGTFHAGSALFVLCAVLAIHWSHSRLRVPLSIVAFVLLTSAVASDPLALYAGALPIMIVYGARIATSAPRVNPDILRATLIAVISALVGALLQKYGGRFIGVTVFAYPTTGYSFATIASIPNNAGVALLGWLQTFGADYPGHPVNAHSLNQLLHAVGYAFVVACAVYAIVRSVQAARGGEVDSRRPASPLIVWQVLLGIVICNVAAVVFTTVFDSGGASAPRYLAPASFAGAALAGAVGPALLPRLRWRVAAAAIAIVYIGFLPLSFRYPAAPPIPQQQLAQWLVANHLHHGLAGYWSANTTSLESGGQVLVLPVAGSTGRIGPVVAITNTSWFHSDQYTNFVILDDPSHPLGGPDCCVYGNIAIRTFGPPARVVQVDGYTIMIWDHNILPSLSRKGVL